MADNAITIENQKPGTPKSVWDAPASNQIEGFATQISVEHGTTVGFKVNLNVAQNQTAPYHIEIYRLGYYGGNGATLVTTLSGLTGRAQPNPLTDARGLVDAGNWSQSASWATPSTAVSGVYLAKLVRDDNGSTNQVPFIVRADESHSDIVLQTSDTTWQAYNGWGGRNGQVGPSLYGGFNQPASSPDEAPLDQNRAFAVSYNRPIITRGGGGTYAGPQDYLFGGDYAAVSWLEKNGYDVSYISGVDTDRLGVAELTNHKAYISVGHDEYWSGGERANVEAARDAGVNLLFWSGNEIYWKTRWENSIADGTAFRTLVTYKESKFNYSASAQPQDYANIDPNNQWTGTWRDIRFVNSVGPDGVTHTAVGAKPENALSGQFTLGDGTGQFGGALNVPAAMAGLRVWRDTGVGANGASNIAPGIIGYEWDTSPNDAFRPAGLVKLSDTTLSWGGLITNNGNDEAPGTGQHSITLYRAPSGALVFGAGTVFWSWGLSNQHDSSPYGANIESRTLQQFAVNMFADMGIQPAAADSVLSSQGLIRASASADHTAATSTLNAPASVSAQTPVTLSGSATDVGGKVAIVEVSVDGGQTWKLAQGAGTWSFNWTPTTPGSYTVEARAIDDSLNLPSGGQIATRVVSVGGSTAASLFATNNAPAGALNNDGQGVELGMKFTASQTGTITALRYFRASGDASDTDTRAGHLWSSSGALLGTATFTSPPGQSGWQVASLSTPVQIQPGTTYVVSYHTADNYLAVSNFFTNSVTDPSGQLTAPSSASSGGNGVYAYGSGAPFPNQSFQASNYWADVAFTPSSGGAGSTPQIGFSTTSLTLAEGASGTTPFTYTLTRTGPTTGASSVAWAVTGSGTNPANAADFQNGVLPSGSVSFAAGETSKTITVNVAGDTTVEPNENFTVTLSGPSGATLGTATAAGTINNDDGVTTPQIGFSTAAVTLAEGNSGTTAFTYTVTRTGPTTGASSATWAVAGSGTNPANAADFQNGVLPSGSVSFAAGETSKTVTVNVAGDTTVEPNENFTVTLSGPSGATLGTATAAGTINNDDGATGSVSLFGTTTPTATMFNDNSAVELGMKFSVSQAGTISALRYYRAAADANDTDVRAGHLWSSTGTLLGTVTFNSAPGQSGWQVANLTTPVQIQSGVTYVVAYDTANNYLATSNYFANSATDPTGVLTAPSSASSGGDGVYRYGSGAQFPNQSFQASNYWVDVVFTPSGAAASQAVAAAPTASAQTAAPDAFVFSSEPTAQPADPLGASLLADSVQRASLLSFEPDASLASALDLERLAMASSLTHEWIAA